MAIDLIIEGIKCDLSEDIAADITYSLADIRTPDKRQVNYSKTITLAGTNTNNYIFGYIHDIDVENPDYNPALPNIGVNFSPKKLAKATMVADGIQIFDGTLRLWKISYKEGFIYYEISLYGKLFDLFGTMADKKLTDIDFSEFNHAFTWENIQATWASNYAGAFVYPLIDYGVNIVDSSERPATFKFGSLIASFFYRVLLDKIFATNGANYVLNFADRTIFDKLFITPNTGNVSGKPKYFIADLTANSKTYTPPAPVYDGFGHYNYNYTDQQLECFNRVSNNVILNGIPAQPAYQTFNADVSTSFQIKIEVVVTNFASDYNPASAIHFFIRLIPQNGSQQDLAMYKLFPTKGTSNYSITLELPQTDFKQGDQFIPMVTPCEAVTFYIKAGATVMAISPNDANVYPLLTGDIYDMSKSVPTDFTQVNFIKDFIKLFNLFVTQNPDDATTYIFTPATNFYNNDKSKVIDWSNKIDRGADIDFTPLSQLTAKSYIFTWKQDNDFWCTNYFNLFKEVYGQVTYLTDTDVITNIETIEFLCSPAVMQRYKNSKVICAAIYKLEANNGIYVRKPDKFNNRLLIWGGLQDAGHSIDLLNADGSVHSTVLQYPFAAHIDNPVSPSFDLNFGNTNGDLPTASKSQFSVYWGKPLKDANHKDGKLVACSALIMPEDITGLDFAGLYKVDNQFYRLNKISGFNPFETNTSLIELIKVLDLPAPVIPLPAPAPDPTPTTNSPAISISSNTVSGNIRSEVFTVGSDIVAGNIFNIEVYSHTVAITAIQGDTATLIAQRAVSAINATTAAQWNSAGTAPATGTAGFKPTATYNSGGTFTITLDAVHQFVAWATVN